MSTCGACRRWFTGDNMMRLAMAIATLVLLSGLTSCGNSDGGRPASGSASCADFLHRKGQVFGTWFLKRNDIRLVGHRYIAVFKDCAERHPSPRPADVRAPNRRRPVEPGVLPRGRSALEHDLCRG